MVTLYNNDVTDLQYRYLLYYVDRPVYIFTLTIDMDVFLFYIRI